MYDPNEKNLAKVVVSIKQYLSQNHPYKLRQTHYHNNIIGAGGLIYDITNNKVLVVKGQEKWSLPKGHRDNTEEPYQTAMREIFEETSIHVSLTPLSKSKRALKCIYYFICVTDTSNLSPHPIDKIEVTDVQWCTRSQLLQLCCNKQLRYFIKRWDSIVDFFKRQQMALSYQLSAD